MLRLLLSLMSVLWTLSFAFAQNFDTPRTWRDSTGEHTIEASFADYESGTVSLRKDDGTQIKIAITRLSDKDRDHIGAIQSVIQTQKQAELLRPHIEQVVTKPAGTVEIINALIDEYPLAVGATLYGGCVYAIIAKDEATVSRSRRSLDQCIENLERIERHFPGLYVRTHAAALNNRAIVAIREGSVTGAVNFLSEASSLSEEIPFAVYHNASLLLNSQLDLGNSKSDLAKVLATGRPEGVEAVENYLMYTLSIEPLVASSNENESPSEADKEAYQAPSPGKFRVATGSGFLIGPDLVLTNAHVAEGCDSFRISNDAGFSMNAVTLKQSRNPSIDLALLKLESSTEIPPIPLRLGESGLPSLGEQLFVLGYPDPDSFERSLTTSGGVVNKLVEERLSLIHDASTDPGNSGGPCVDMNGNVLGVHYAGSAVAKDTRNYAVTPMAMEVFLSDVENFNRLPVSESKASSAEIISSCKDAVFFIECFSNKIRRRTASAAMPSESVMVRHRLIPDKSCLLCTSKGYIGCGKCANGYIYTPVRAKIGTTVTGAAIYGTKNAKSRCSNCRRGKIPCPNCRGTGRIP